MQLAREGQRVTDTMRDGVVTGTMDRSNVQGGAYNYQLPRKFDATSPYDNEMQQKLALMDADGMTPFGQVYYDERTAKWMEHKAAASELANMDEWFNKNFNKSSLADRQRALELWPEFYKAREQELLDRIEMVKKIRLIQLRGPQSEDDVRIQYLLNTGRVRLPADWDRIGVDPTGGRGPQEQSNLNNFFAGLFKVPLFSTQSQRAAQARNNTNLQVFGEGTGPATNAFSWNSGAALNVPFAGRGHGQTLQDRQLERFGQVNW